MQQVLYRHNICLLLPMFPLFTKRIRTQEENKAINRWSLRWCSAPTGIPQQLVVCQSTFPLLISLSPLTQFKSWCPFPQLFLPTVLPAFQCPFICLFNYTLLHRLQLLTALLSIFLSDSLIPPMFLYSFLPPLVLSTLCFPEELSHGTSRQQGGTENTIW